MFYINKSLGLSPGFNYRIMLPLIKWLYFKLVEREVEKMRRKEREITDTFSAKPD